MITTLTLNPALDLTLTVDQFVADDSNRVSAARKDPGGKGFNVSRVVRRLGYPTTAIGFLGGHAGQEVMQYLKDEGIYVWHIPTQAETRVNVTISNVASAQQTKFNQKGPRILKSEWSAMVNLLMQVIDHASVLVLSGSLPPGLPDDIYASLVEQAKKLNPTLKIVVDADGPALKHAVEARPFLIKPNLYELNRLMDTQLTTTTSDAEILVVLQKLRRRGPEAVLLSMGAAGVMYVSKNGVLRAQAPRTKVRTTVGAGDSLLAGFVTGLARHQSETEALRLGLACAGATLSQPGTHLAQPADVRRLLKRIEIC